MQYSISLRKLVIYANQPAAALNFLWVLIFFFSNFISSYSQKTASGKLTNSNNEPVSYAQFFFKDDQSTGTISNEVGEFKLYIYSHNLEDTLMISIQGSAMDTLSYALAIEELSKIDNSCSVIMSAHNSLALWGIEKYGSEETKKKYLPQMTTGEVIGAFCLSSFDLEEITIVSDSYLKKILKEAINKIEYNYPTEEHRLRGYYQEYTISDTTYTELIEADVTVNTNSYTSDP